MKDLFTNRCTPGTESKHSTDNRDNAGCEKLRSADAIMIIYMYRTGTVKRNYEFSFQLWGFSPKISLKIKTFMLHFRGLLDMPVTLQTLQEGTVLCYSEK